MRQGLSGNRWVGIIVLVCVLLSAIPLWAQHDEHGPTSMHEEVVTGYEHHGTVGSPTGWEGSIAGIAYSEFNHHLTGMLVDRKSVV